MRMERHCEPRVDGLRVACWKDEILRDGRWRRRVVTAPVRCGVALEIILMTLARVEMVVASIIVYVLLHADWYAAGVAAVCIKIKGHSMLTVHTHLEHTYELLSRCKSGL